MHWISLLHNVVRKIVEETCHIHELKWTCPDLTKEKKDHRPPKICNIEADHEAAKMRHTMSGPVHHAIVVPASGVIACVNGQCVNSSLNQLLCEACTINCFWKHADQKFQWTRTTQQLISWQVLFDTLKK